MSQVLETPISQIEPLVQEDSVSQDITLESTPLDTLDGIHFKLHAFEGPLDLLLHLIREQKIDIYDIPIVEITHQYMEYIGMLKELNLEIAGEFLLMAATLIHIKSKMLLPPDTEKIEEPAEDPRAELVQRLLEYKAYKDSSSHLRKREDIWKNVFRRSALDIDSVEFEPEPALFEANAYDLIAAFKKLLEKVPEQAYAVTRETLTVTDRLNYIVGRLEKEDGLKFEDLFEAEFTKLTLIVTFIALLEVVRLGLARLYQEKEFDQIWVLNPRQESSEGPGCQEVADPEEVLS